MVGYLLKTVCFNIQKEPRQIFYRGSFHFKFGQDLEEFKSYTQSPKVLALTKIITNFG